MALLTQPRPDRTMVEDDPVPEQPVRMTALETTDEEEREKDFTTFRLGARRRMWGILIVGVALFVAVATRAIPPVPRAIMAAIAIIAFLLNGVLTALATGVS